MKRATGARRSAGGQGDVALRVVAAASEDGREATLHAEPGATLVARVAMPGYRAVAGDRVLVVDAGACAFVIGVVEGAQVVCTPGGASAAAEGEAIVVRDRRGDVVVTYDGATGEARVAAPAGDLTLAAPHGRVRLEAARDVELRAGRDVTLSGSRRVTVGSGEARLEVQPSRVAVAAPLLEIDAARARLGFGDADVLAERLSATATDIACVAGKIEVTAERVVERVVDAYREVEGLLHTRAGRVRTLVSDLYTLSTGRTVLTSKDDTSVDGKRILLG